MPPSLVLVGGGHAHVEVLRRWARRPSKAVRLTLVVDRAESVYSGMVPGVIAGQYDLAEATIDLRPLAAAAGAQLIVAPVMLVDPHGRSLTLRGHAPVPYDVASLNVGSVPQGLASPAVPGLEEHALTTRPIGDLVKRLDVRLARLPEATAARPLRVVVVGGGAAGVELAFALRTRLQRWRNWVHVTLLGPAPSPLPAAPKPAVRKILGAMKRRGVAYHGGCKVVEVRSDAVMADGDGEALSAVAADLVIWATGAAPPCVISDSDLPRDARGFVLTTPTLQVKHHPSLLAVGDCAALEEHPQVPRAGVFAVRAGAVLAENLERWLAGRPLQPYRPQNRYLAILNTADGRAVAVRGGWCAQGKMAWLLKDFIDRRFMSHYSGKSLNARPHP